VVAAGLAALGEQARGGGKLMPAVVGAVKVGATVGEIADALRAVFGEYRESVTV
jgi:methylmalonyl-CoA mutase N-terminal domain/subunit